MTEPKTEQQPSGVPPVRRNGPQEQQPQAAICPTCGRPPLKNTPEVRAYWRALKTRYRAGLRAKKTRAAEAA